MRKPEKVWSDSGKEFYNTTILHFLKEQNNQIYSISSDLKAVFVERFNRTLSDLIKEPMYNEGKGNWLNHLDAALQKYSNRVHGTTKMTPFEMSFCAASQSAIPNNNIINNNINHNNNKLPKFRAASPKFPKFHLKCHFWHRLIITQQYPIIIMILIIIRGSPSSLCSKSGIL